MVEIYGLIRSRCRCIAKAIVVSFQTRDYFLLSNSQFEWTLYLNNQSLRATLSATRT